MKKFWLWLRKLSNKKVKQHYMNRYYHDRKCPNCNIWTSEVNGCKSLIDTECGVYQFMECSQCGWISRWNMMCMLPMLDEPAAEEE